MIMRAVKLALGVSKIRVPVLKTGTGLVFAMKLKPLIQTDLKKGYFQTK